MSFPTMDPGVTASEVVEGLRIVPAGADNFCDLYRAWAEAEDWNPGRHEGAALLAQDPDGCFIGYLGDTPVSTISVINYDDQFAFLDCYRVAPEHRGRGLGLATWKHAVAHAQGRTIGLEGVPAQQANYRESGFTTAHRTVRYTGRLPAPRTIRTDVIVPATDVGGDAIAAFDADTFPADRPRFLASWLTAPDHHGLALVSKRRVCGVGVIRPARTGARIGPLLADTPTGAAMLFDALVGHAAANDAPSITIDVPEPNLAARALAVSHGLAPVSETARMYTGPVRRVADERIFGICTLEAG
jgi:GNAT superfamily N-acetyltransferase